MSDAPVILLIDDNQEGVGRFMTTRSALIALPATIITVLTCMAAAPVCEISAQQRLDVLLGKANLRTAEPAIFIQIADLYLDLGDEVYSHVDQRRSAYERGAQAAQKALDLQERNAEAHYLYAANLGNAAQLKGVMASAFMIGDLKRHVKRALELSPHHPAALHMMGMMLEELPWVLGGDADEALSYLRRAVAADPGYEHARLDLAKAYVKRKDVASAAHEVKILLEQPLKPDACTAEQHHRQEARELQARLSTR